MVKIVLYFLFNTLKGGVVEKRRSTLFSFPTLLFVLLTLSFLFNANAQIDNPLLDQVPIEYLQNYNPDVLQDAVVTDSDGYDNFNLGNNFAEPHITQNPMDPLEYFGAYNINDAWRTYDGLNWTFSVPNFGTTMRGDPVTAYDSLGNLYYMNMFGSIAGAKVMRSTDNGASWGPSVTGVSGVDKCWIAADQTSGPYANNVYCVMTAGSGSGNFSRSTDFGASFQNTATFNTQVLPGMMVAVGPNVSSGDVPGGAVYVVTNSGSAFASTYTFYVSTNGGSNFTFKSAQSFSNYVGTNVNGRNSVQNMRTRPYPFITADNSYGPNRGRLYLVYASNSPAGNGNKSDIFCRYSDDQGATWSSAVVVNDDANSQNHFQWHPATWVDKSSGRLFVHWMDTRDTPSSDSAMIYGTYSDDGGVTFATNQKISNAKMRINCSTCGGGGTPRYQGDYDGIIAMGDISMSIWTDFRAGTFGSYVGYFPDFAMKVNPSMQTVENNLDSTFFWVSVPDVKLYDQTATFSAEINPIPAGGTVMLDFPDGDVLSSYPDSLRLRVRTSGFVTTGNYTITVKGEGPNGTPVHERTVSLQVDPVIPVELTSFNAAANKNQVMLSWSTATETNNQGFEIERKTVNEAEFHRVGFVEGNGTTTEPQSYSFTDTKLEAGVYSYRLKQVDYDGTFEYYTVTEVEITTPLEYALEQNYPNPFNPSTTISYSLPSNDYVTLKIYDVLGNEVATLVNQQQDAGRYDVIFSASSLASGIYYYHISAGDFTQTRKLMLMK